MAYTLRPRLGHVVNKGFGLCQHARRYPFNAEFQARCFASREDSADEELQKPVRYTTSRANVETAQGAREKVTMDDSPWSQTISLGLSLAAFLVYFGILREPNDLDILIESDINDKVPGFKEANDKLKSNQTRRMPLA